jgi:hypothetical protein
MEPECSLPYLQEPPTGSCSEQDKASTQYPTAFHYDPFSYCLHLDPDIQSGPFYSGFATKIVYAFISRVRALCSGHLILLNSITLTIFGEE